MNAAQKHVAVIGAGVAGLTAANALANHGVRVTLFEKTPFLGGHAIQLNCKATEACVKCGACVVEDRLTCASSQSTINFLTGTKIESIVGSAPYRLDYLVHSPLVNADRCNGCGICFKKCPVPGAILQGRAPRVGSYVAIRRELCRYFDNAACTLCRDTCPQNAIHLSETTCTGTIEADAILVTTGFSPYNPNEKPYGYGQFPNVITSLDAERMLREDMILKRPSDGRPAKRVAFIQCVGSRDARLGHAWCSKICCGSSMRMARMIQYRQKEVQVAFFYIDVQSFGNDFPIVYQHIQDNMTMTRAIPGEIRRNAADDLEAIYFDPKRHESIQAVFDVIVLSVGLLPGVDNQQLADILKLPLAESGFLPSYGIGNADSFPEGVFTAGSALGPMSIAESVGSAEKAAYDIFCYLGIV